MSFLDWIFEISSQTVNKIKFHGLDADYGSTATMYANVACKMHISAYQAYIQDVTKGTSHPLKILDHQISHFHQIKYLNAVVLKFSFLVIFPLFERAGFFLVNGYLNGINFCEV